MANITLARALWGNFNQCALSTLRELLRDHHFSIATGDLIFLDGHWYVTYTGLLRLSRRKHCSGINVRPVRAFCDPKSSRWAFAATVYKSAACKGFVGYGDADPSNVSVLVRGAEMRVAETRAVNRALRKAYGIGICSVEEIHHKQRRSRSSDDAESNLITLCHACHANAHGVC
jgi:HNH endonuclease